MVFLLYFYCLKLKILENSLYFQKSFINILVLHFFPDHLSPPQVARGKKTNKLNMKIAAKEKSLFFLFQSHENIYAPSVRSTQSQLGVLYSMYNQCTVYKFTQRTSWHVTPTPKGRVICSASSLFPPWQSAVRHNNNNNKMAPRKLVLQRANLNL